MFALGSRYCGVCGMKVGEGAVKKDGKDFCSEEHATRYSREQKRARQLAMSRQLSQKSSAMKKCGHGSGCH